ncbi:MAG TPA: hypothetical protein VEK34_04465 [Methylocella sp.]|nr:hypothetical protein [Methylocella sp.]
MGTTQNPDPDSTVSQLREGMTSALSSADTTAAQTVQNLQLVHQARLSGLTRTAAAAKAKYGSDSTEAKQAEQAVAGTTNLIARLAVIYQQSITPSPTVSAKGWALHGRVYNAQLQPASRYTVYLVNAQKIYQQAYGFAYTDNTGYFLINYEGQETEETPELFIEVANAKAEPVYLSTTPSSRPPAAPPIRTSRFRRASSPSATRRRRSAKWRFPRRNSTSLKD